MDLGHVIVGCIDSTTAAYDLGHKTATVQDEHVGADSVKKKVSRPPVLGLVALAGGARLS